MKITKIAFVVQGLFEKSDSIGYDTIFQFKILRKIFGSDHVLLFAERFDRKLHADVPIEPISGYWDFLDKTPDAVTIYHYCDGWAKMDDYILNSKREFVVRWHNNTPPWFYGATHRRLVERTVGGFRTIMKFITRKNVRFWVNSNFTLEQLCVLGASRDQAAVVYPGRRIIEPDNRREAEPKVKSQGRDVAGEGRPLQLLFVSRVVAHKGHLHVVSFAGALKRAVGREVSVIFIGRDDPAATLKSDLIRLARQSEVEIQIRGEVSEPDLQSAYAGADVFVCFSEHEGFGMPVFEAMRMGLPVICWGRTALRELMQDHPFTLDDLDFARAIASVRLIENDVVRADVQEIQSAIVGTYTVGVITRQLHAALEQNFGFWRDEKPDYCRIAEVRENISDKLDQQRLGSFIKTPHPSENSDNFVTIYDIESYEGLLSYEVCMEKLGFGGVNGDSVRFAHHNFITTTGQKHKDAIEFSTAAPALKKGHVIFGPYRKFVRGNFAVDFDLGVELSGTQTVLIELDVAIEGGARLARRWVTARQIQAGGAPRLRFEITTANAVVEFRIMVRRPGDCLFQFRGVTVSPVRKTSATGRWRPKIALPNLSWASFLRLTGLRGTKVSAPARAHFARANVLRDRMCWNDAAVAYAQGLEHAPHAFAQLVQWGNCLKEAKRFEEGAVAYQRALALEPDNQDAHLQIGRLYRAWGKPDQANSHLLQAAQINRVAAEAMLELTEEGFDISALHVLHS